MTHKKVGGERLVAAILDAIIVGILAIIPMGIFLITQGFEALFDFYVDGTGMVETGDSYNLMLIISSVSELVIGVIYFVYIPFKWNGQTLGKKVMSIKAVDEFGENPTFKQHLIRGIQNWGTYVTILTVPLLYVNLFAFSIVGGFLGAGVSILTIVSLILLLVKDDGKGLHDMLAGTLVVKSDVDFNQTFVEKTTQMGDWADVEYSDDDTTKDDDWLASQPKDTPTDSKQDNSDEDDDPWKY